jgi:ribonuclease J
LARKQQQHNVRITPLGGIGEVGKNMTVIEYGDEMIIIDCGLCFPREDMLGVDYVIPDITYLRKNKEKIKAVLITHGHEDHIGATPYLLPEIGAPVYGTDLTLALIGTKLAEHKIDGVPLNVIKPGDKVSAGVFNIEAIRVTHSIDAALGFAVNTPEGIIVHTGDFKVDYTPVDGRVIDLAKFAQLGSDGVLALMSDSTNAENPGYTMSESTVGDTFESYFKKATGRIIVATFASNIHRLQQVISASKRYGRKVCLTGRSMLKIAKVATELGYLCSWSLKSSRR